MCFTCSCYIVNGTKKNEKTHFQTLKMIMQFSQEADNIDEWSKFWREFVVCLTN